MTYNSTTTTLAVIAIAYRIILWAVPGTRPIEAVQSATLLWYCFRAVVNLVLWLIRAAFWTMLFLTRTIL